MLKLFVFWITPIAILVSKAKSLKNVNTHNPAYSTLLIWVILVVIFFSISPGKRGVYVLPALPALSMVAGLVLENSPVSRGLVLFARAVTSLISAVLLIAGLALLFHEPTAAKLMTRFDSDSETLVRLSIVLLVLGFAGLVLILSTMFTIKSATQGMENYPPANYWHGFSF